MTTTLHPNTVKIGQTGMTAEQLRLVKLGANASNAVYNADLEGKLLPGQWLDNTGDVRGPQGGVPQSYASEPGWQVVDKVVSVETGGKAVIFRNADTNEVMVAFAGMDGFSNGQDNGSGVVYNAGNQTLAMRPEIEQALQGLAAGDKINADTKFIITGQSMGLANALNFTGMLTTDDQTKQLDLGGSFTLDKSNVTVVGLNGEGTTNAVLDTVAGTSISELANSGAGFVYTSVGYLGDGTGMFDIVTPLLTYPMPDGTGVIVLPASAATVQTIGGLHSTHTGIFPALAAVIANPGLVKIFDHPTFTPEEVLTIARYVATIGDPSGNLNLAEGYLRTAVMGAVAAVLDYTPGTGNMIGAAITQTTENKIPYSISRIMGWGVELVAKGFAINNPVLFLKLVVGGLGLARLADPGNSTEAQQRAAAANAIRPAQPGETREFWIDPNSGDWFVSDTLPNNVVIRFDQYGNTSRFDLTNQTSVHYSPREGVTVERAADGNGTIKWAMADGTASRAVLPDEIVTIAKDGTVAVTNLLGDLETKYQRGMAPVELQTEMQANGGGAVTRVYNRGYTLTKANGSEKQITAEQAKAETLKAAEGNIYSGVASLLQSLRSKNELGIVMNSVKVVSSYITYHGLTSGSVNTGEITSKLDAGASALGVVSALQALNAKDLRTQVGGAVSLLYNSNALMTQVAGKQAAFLSDGSLKVLGTVGAILSIASAGDIGQMLENGQVGSAALTAINAINGAAYLGSVAAGGSGVMLIPVDPTTMVIMIVAAAVLDELFSEDPPPPPPTGEAHFQRDAQGQLTLSVTGENGGREILQSSMDKVLANLTSQLRELNHEAGTGNGLEFVASRMPKVSIFSWMSEENNLVSNYFFVLTYADPQTGEERQMLLSRFDLEGHYAESLVYPEALVSQWQYAHMKARYGDEANFKTEGQWATSVDPVEVERTRLQGVVGAADAALNQARDNADQLRLVDRMGANVDREVTQAAQAQVTQASAALDAATKALEVYALQNPQDPQLAARIDANHQWLKAIAVDLGNDGITRRALPAVVKNDLDSLQKDNVARFDVDNDGYFEATEWLGNQDAFLALDRDGNNSIDAGSELFNGIYTAFGQRGTNSLKYYDSNQDGRIDRADPVFKLLRLWMDLNGDGLSGSAELLDMDMKFAGVDMAALSAQLQNLGAAAQAALNSGSPVNYIDLSTMRLHFQDGGTSLAQDVTLRGQTEGIQIERDTATSNLTVVSESGVRENYVTLVEDMSQLQALKDPGKLSSARIQELTTLAAKYGLNPQADDFMPIVDALKTGGERTNPTGAIYVSEDEVLVNTELKAALERMRLSVHAVFDADRADVGSILESTATLQAPIWAGSAVDMGASSDAKRNEWFETLKATQAVSDPLNPDGVVQPNPVKPTILSQVHVLEYAVKGAQDGGLVTRTPVIASNPQSPGQTQTIQVFTTAAPSRQLQGGTYAGKEDERFTFGFEQLQSESKALLATTGAVRLLGVRETRHGRVEVDEVTGRVVFVADKDYNGTEAGFTYSVMDQGGQVSDRRIGFNLQAVNDAPVLTGETVTAEEDHPLLLSPALLLANDKDIEGEQLTMIGVGRVGLGRAVLEETGQIRYTPPSDLYGITDTLEYVVQDASGATSVAVVKITINGVNDAPTVVSERIRNVKEDTNVRIAADLLLANDYDPDVPAGQARPALRLTGVGTAEHGQVFLDSAGQVMFVPDTNFNGIARFQYKVADEHGSETIGWAEIEIDAVNDAVQARGESVESREDARLVFDPAVLLANDEDPEVAAGKQKLTLIQVDNAVHGTVSLEDGRVVFIPTENFNGEASFRYTVSDGAGGVSSATVRIDVASVNDLPETRDIGFTGQEDTPLVITRSQLLAQSSDVEDGRDGLSLANVGNALGGSLVAQSNGTYVFTPLANFAGTASFDYEVVDGAGARSKAKAYVTVDQVNDAPVFVPGSAIAQHGTEAEEFRVAESALLKMFTDVDGDVVSLDIASLSTQAGDSVRFDAVTREVVFRAPENVSGARYFDVRVKDAHGAPSATQRISFTLDAINHAPVVSAVALDVLEDGGNRNPYQSTRNSVRISDILSKASDTDGDVLQMSWVGNGKTADGKAFDVALNAQPGYISFNTPLNYHGQASFEFKISDGKGGEIKQKAYLNVAAVNDLPVATITLVNSVSDFQTFRIDAYDPDSSWDALSFSVLRNPVGGTVMMGQEAFEAGRVWGIPIRGARPAAKNVFTYDFWDEKGKVAMTSDIVFKVSDGDAGGQYTTVNYPLTYRYDPIVIDLNSDGLGFYDIEQSTVSFDPDGNGVAQRVGWVKPTEGILAWDHNHDGVINRFDEIEFWSHVQPRDPLRSDLNALSQVEFDSNQDGRFDQNDTRWSEFKLWRDLNTNGVSDAGELQTLAQAGIKTVYLRANTLNQLYGEHTLLRGFTRVEMQDGRMLQAGDVQFSFAPEGWTPPVRETTVVSNIEVLSESEAAALEVQGREISAMSLRVANGTFELGAQSVAANQQFDQKTLSGEIYQIKLAASLFQGLDSSQQYTVTLANGQPLPEWLKYDSGTRTLKGTPGGVDIGNLSLSIQGKDSFGKTASATVALQIADTNTAPVQYGQLPPQVVREGEPFELDIAPNLFRDGDAGDALRIQVARADGSALPGWLRFDPVTMRFHGTPQDADVGAVEIRLTATDKAQISAHAYFKIVVDNVNEAPVATTAPLPMPLNLGQPNTIQLPANLFKDPDLTDHLSYSVSAANGDAMPSWLSFNASTLTFTGTPTAANLDGRLQIKVTATDTFGESASVLVDFTPRIVGTANNDVLHGGSGWEYIDGGNGNDMLNAGGGNDVLIGGQGDDTLRGGAGIDIMIGGEGGDDYELDELDDVVQESGTSGTDIVHVVSDMDYVVQDGIEEVWRGNAGASVTTGSARRDYLYGGDGSDTLIGLDGDDLLNGSNGVDELRGGKGNDLYMAPGANDLIVEMAGEGTDMAQLYLRNATFVLPDHVENVNWYDGAQGVLQANGEDNYIQIYGDHAVVHAGGGHDTILDTVGGSTQVFNETFHGDGGDDTLVNRYGVDSLYGGQGNDRYQVWNAGTQVTEYAGEGIDTIAYFLDQDYTLGANIEGIDLRYLTTARITTGNGLDNLMIGSKGNDTLRGGLGDDTLQGNQGADELDGGAGNDVYRLGYGQGIDTIKEAAGTAGGFDTIEFDTAVAAGGLSGVRNATTATITTATGEKMTFNWNATDGLAIERFVFKGTGAVWDEAEITRLLSKAPTGSVTVSGTWKEGQVLTATHNLADADGMGAVTLEWLRNGNAIIGSTGGSYTLTQADVGKRITARAVYVDGFGVTETVTSSQGSFVTNVNNTPTGSVTIAGTAQQGQVLTASNTLGDVDGMGAVSYRWLRNQVYIEGATNSTYTLTQADVGATIRVQAAYRDGQGYPETVNSAATVAVANVNDAPTGAVTIQGEARQGQTLTATHTLADADGLGTVTFQWLKGGVDTGKRGGTYLLADTDIQQSISVRAVYTDARGQAESVSSAASAPVVPGDFTITGSVGNDDLLGGLGKDTLHGLGGHDTLDGDKGTDLMAGGDGDDTYFVDGQYDDAEMLVAQDTVVETDGAGSGIDTVHTDIDQYILPANVERLVMTGKADVNTARGNALDNHVTGTDEADVISGVDGNDTLLGGQGNDTLAGGNGLDRLEGGAGADELDGGVGLDTMVGGGGNDYYYLDGDYVDYELVGIDTIIELDGGGNDTVVADVDAYVLGDHVENLVMTGKASVNHGTGNGLANHMTGSNAHDELRGMGGDDTILGGSGNDTLYGDAGNDSLEGGAGHDRMDGGQGNDVLKAMSTTSNNTYFWGRGDGQDTLTDAGGTDLLNITQAVTADQVWLRHVGNDLEIAIIGGGDSFTVTGWYTGTANRVEKLKLADGRSLTSDRVQNMVDAMAAFTPPAQGQTTLPGNYQTALSQAIATNWV